MRLLLTVEFLVLFNLLYSQNTFIEFEDNVNGKLSHSELIITDSISYWNEKFDDQTIVSGKEFLMKMHLEDRIYYYDEIFKHAFYVKDSLHNMKWALNNDTAVILNEKCNSAKTYFRGRWYTAYYTTALPFSDGPWKFGGLPGLILKVASDDRLYQYSAEKIIMNYAEKIEPVNIKAFTFLEWDQFVDEFISTIDKWMKLVRSNGSVENGSKVKLKIDAPEIIYPKAQQADGLSF
jgi:GLPGLI family protein